MTDKDTTTAAPRKRGVKKGTKRGYYKKSGSLNEREQMIFETYKYYCAVLGQKFAVSAAARALAPYKITKWGVITVLRKNRKILERRQLEIKFNPGLNQG